MDMDMGGMDPGMDGDMGMHPDEQQMMQQE